MPAPSSLPPLFTILARTIEAVSGSHRRGTHSLLGSPPPAREELVGEILGPHLQGAPDSEERVTLSAPMAQGGLLDATAGVIHYARTKFHPVQLAANVLESFRRCIWQCTRGLPEQGIARKFKGPRWVLLKNPKTSARSTR